jgi:hypothetical protein
MRHNHASVLLSALGLVACGGAQTPAAPPAPPQPVEVSLEAATVRRGEAAPAAPTSEPAQVAAGGDGGVATPAAPPVNAVAEAVRQALDARHAALVQCYDDVLRQSPDAVGRMAVELVANDVGTIERVSTRVEGEGSLARARPCVEQALRAVQLTNPPPQGMRIRRSYSFVNPPVEITVATPLAITSRRPRRAAPATPAEAPTGVLREAEVVAVLTDHAGDLQTCYANLLRTVRNAAGSATLTFTVSGEGAVTEAALADAQPPLDGMRDCIVAAVRALRFRGTGTAANVRYPLTFAR